MAVNGGHAGTKKGPNWGHVRLPKKPFCTKTATAHESVVPFSQVPKRVVSKRVVLADVPLYRLFSSLLFGSFTFWQFGAASLPTKGGRPRPTVFPELKFVVH